jgi:type I restriction enzyme, S subunit
MCSDNAPVLQDFEIGDPLECWTYPPSHWSKTKLWDLAEYINGRAFKQRDFATVGLQVIKITELKYGISEDTTRYAGRYDVKHLLRRRDLLFAWSGNPETSLDVFWWRDGEALLNQHIFRVIPRQGIDKAYLFYLLKFLRPTFIRTARDKATSMGHVKVSDLKRLIAFVPPPIEQSGIANILEALDDKIELNRRMNDTLETLARAVFKSWFLDFEPVRAIVEGRQPHNLDANTAALFPHAFEHSALGKIPQGWRVGKMAELMSLGREVVNPQDFPDEVFEHYSIPAFDEGRCPKDETGEQIKSNKFLVPEDAVLLSKLNPRLARVWLPTVSGVRRSIASTEFLVASPQRDFSREYTHALFSSQGFLDVFESLVTGTSGSHQRVKPEFLLAMDVVIPSPHCIECFTRVAGPLYEKTARNLAESRNLVSIRDVLLPKLISGEIRVKDAEKMAEKAV